MSDHYWIYSTGQITCNCRGEFAFPLLANIEGELVIFVVVRLHQHQICSTNGESSDYHSKLSVFTKSNQMHFDGFLDESCAFWLEISLGLSG